MSETMIQILSSVGLFALGVLVGAMLQRGKGEASKNKRLEQKISELQDTHTKYQADVSSHFMETARLVQTLNKSYRDVHAQLAKGASRLCDDEHADDFLALSFSSTPESNKTATKLDNENGVYVPPMDYAPKDTPDQEGTLSEKFGLDDGQAPVEEKTDEEVKEPPRV